MKASKRVLSALLGLAVALGATHDAAAQGGPKEEARTYFNAGVQAYKGGQFLAAGQAFIEAHKLFKRPELAFSIAQAFRRQFQVDHTPRHLRVAVWYYRQYLAEVKRGGRRLEAVRGLSELTPHLAKLGIEDVGPPPEVQFATSLMITSPTPGAVVKFDDGPTTAVGLSQEVKPGSHQAVIMASGYHTETRALVAHDGQMVALDVRLREKPALLNVVGADGAEVTVDGRSSGEAPFPRPLELAAGRHFVSITERGHKPFAQELSFDPGASTTVDVSLPETDQRVAAYVVLATGVATMAAGGSLGLVALFEENEAQSVLDEWNAGRIEETRRVEYNEAVSSRDDFVWAAAITAGAGGALAITGLFLLLLDQPVVSQPLLTDEQADESKPGGETDPDIELLAAPVLQPNRVGLSVVVRF